MDEHAPQRLGDSTGRADAPLKPTRRMTVADILTLVAAAGVGLFAVRLHLQEDRFFQELADIGVPLSISTEQDFFWTWVIRTLPFLVAGAPALLLIRFRPPRPSRRRVCRQPGTAACLAVILSGSLSVLVAAVEGWKYSTTAPVTNCIKSLEGVGGAVLLVWLTLALAGAWRPAPDWIDRSGRALGVALIALYASTVAVSMVSRS